MLCVIAERWHGACRPPLLYAGGLCEEPQFCEDKTK
jgi:hypothetical protein